jgi:hypothetical protein
MPLLLSRSRKTRLLLDDLADVELPPGPVAVIAMESAIAHRNTAFAADHAPPRGNLLLLPALLLAPGF